VIIASTYETAVERAAVALAHSIFDPSRGEAGAEALIAALRAYVGDKNATAFPVEAFERVQRDILICFGDRFGERLRRKIERRFGTEVAEVVDRLIMEAIAEGLGGFPRPTASPPHDRAGTKGAPGASPAPARGIRHRGARGDVR
jgi:hypothetical protein